LIKCIELTNFQSHKNSLLEFCDGFNVIIGRSDSGKSSVFRSLLWVYSNRPSGDTIRNWDCSKGDTVSVGIGLSEGIEVYKERTNNRVIYQVADSGEVSRFEAVRLDVPKEVLDSFNLSEFNIQTQHDPYFLLNNSPGERAKKLNELVGLDVIDIIFKNLNSKILGSKRNIERIGNSIEEYQERISNLFWLDEAEEKLSDVENSEKELVGRKGQVKQVQDSVGRYDSLLEKLERILPLLGLEKEVSSILEKINLWNQKKNQITSVQGCVDLTKSLIDSIQYNEEWLGVEDLYLSSKKDLDDWSKRVGRLSNVQKVVSEHSNLSLKISEAMKKSEEKVKNFSRLLEKYKVCPMCGGKISKEAIESILK